jgi:hypothetical protein
MTSAQLKTQIDAAITNKITVSSITPTDVGNNCKDIVDYIDQQDALLATNSLVVHKAGAEIITGEKTFTTQLSESSIIVNNSVGSDSISINQTLSGSGLSVITNNTSTGIYVESIVPGTTGISLFNDSYNIGLQVDNNGVGGAGILITNLNGTGLSITNTGLGSGSYTTNLSSGVGSLNVNSGSGSAISIENQSTGIGVDIFNQGTGPAINIVNDINKAIVIASTSLLPSIDIDNQSTGDGALINNASSGTGLIINNEVAASGNPFKYTKNAVDLVTIDNAGNIESVSFIKTGGLATEYLMANGTTSLLPIEFDNAENTIWNNGAGNNPDNTSFGEGVLKSITTGDTNTGFGSAALYNEVTGNRNTAIGAYSMYVSNGGVDNVAVGAQSLENHTTGSYNVAVGSGCGYNLTSGIKNTGIGYAAAGGTSPGLTGSENITVGFQAGRDITSGSNNILIENITNASITTGSRNIVINPLQKAGVTTGNDNVIIGGYDGNHAAGMTGEIHIGTGALNTTRLSFTSAGYMILPIAPLITPSTNNHKILVRDTSTGLISQLNNVGYTVYTALITQAGVGTPTPKVLENTTGATVSWGYSSAGIYTATFSSAVLIADKVAIFGMRSTGGTGNSRVISGTRTNTTVVTFNTENTTGVADVGLTDATIEIRIYN